MLDTHYVEFVTNNDHSNAGYCISKLMTMLHGFMRHTELNFGVSFPSMSCESIGDKVRVFGSVESLTSVLNNEQIQNACKRSICSLSVYVPALIPENAKKVCYVKNRYGNSNIDSEFKRRLKRYNSRHVEQMTKEDQKKLQIFLANKSRQLAYFTIKSEAGIYPVYVEKRDHDENLDNIFNSYGLGNLGGGVYDF